MLKSANGNLQDPDPVSDKTIFLSKETGLAAV
jgi:hypothetical protein